MIPSDIIPQAGTSPTTSIYEGRGEAGGGMLSAGGRTSAEANSLEKQ
jgi:hypothetical protein